MNEPEGTEWEDIEFEQIRSDDDIQRILTWDDGTVDVINFPHVVRCEASEPGQVLWGPHKDSVHVVEKDYVSRAWLAGRAYPTITYRRKVRPSMYKIEGLTETEVGALRAVLTDEYDAWLLKPLESALGKIQKEEDR